MVQKKIIHDVATGKTTVADYTAEEQASYDNYNSTEKITARKLETIKEIRLEKLKETDWWVISEQITDAQKTWRQNLRNIPQDFSTEEEYDLLLARNQETGELTHTIWSKP